MTIKIPGVAVGVLCAAVLASFAGCNATPPLSTMGIALGDREVRVVIDGTARIASLGDVPDTAVVTFDGRTLIIEKERVLFDGGEQARLLADAKKVHIEYRAGKLTVLADGAAVEVTGG